MSDVTLVAGGSGSGNTTPDTSGDPTKPDSQEKTDAAAKEDTSSKGTAKAATKSVKVKMKKDKNDAEEAMPIQTNPSISDAMTIGQAAWLWIAAAAAAVIAFIVAAIIRRRK